MNSRIRTPSMRLVRKQKNQWPNPELSVGHYLGTKNPNYHYYAAQGPAKEAFDNIKAEIQELIETTCGPVRGSGLMFQELYMVGDTPSSAVPYIMISYKKIDVRKKAVAALKEAKVLERCPAGMKIGHWNYPPHVVNQDGFGSSSVTITSRDVSETLECNLVPTADPKVSWKTGAIRLTVNHDNIHRLHNGTIGSIIIVDEKSFYFAPAHVFDSDISDEVTEDGDSECDFGSFVEEDEGFDEDAEVDFMSRYSVTPGSRLSPNDDYPDYGEHSETSSIIQDSHWMLPEPEEHLVESSHSSHMKDEFQTTPSLPPLPTLTIKRPHILSNDMDYSLIEVSTNNSLKSSNLPVLTRENVRSIERDGIEVTAQTGLGVILTGTLSNRPSYTLLPNSTKFQEVFTVKLSGAASKPGDCGTIIRDANTGGIYGHIIAGSVESKVAYIMPAITVLNDLEKRLGAAGALETIDHPSIHVTTTDNGLGIVNADESEIDRRNWPGVPMKTSMARMKVTLDDSKEISMLNWLSGLDYDHEHNHKENVGAADSPLPSSEVDESESLVIVPENREQIQNPRSCRARRQSSPIPDDFASLSDLEQSINAAETMLFDTNRPIESQCSTGVVTSTSPSISNITRLSHLTREDTALCSEIELTSAFDDVLGIVPDIFGKSDSQQYEPWQACEDTAPNHEGLHLDDSQSLIVKNHLRRCNEIFDLDKKIGDSGNPEEARENRDRNQLSPEDYTVG